MNADFLKKRIRDVRQAKGLRASDVARKMGISRPFYTQLESGARRLTVIYLFQIARALEVTISDLCGETLVDKSISEMQGHLIPVNNPRVWKILGPLLAEQPEDLEDWEIVFSQALERVRKAKQEAAGGNADRYQSNRVG